jgi:hypothetical protein
MDFLGIINFDFLRQNITKKSLKIPKEKPEAVIQRKTHNIMDKIKETKRQTINKTLHRKLKIEHFSPYKNHKCTQQALFNWS